MNTSSAVTPGMPRVLRVHDHGFARREDALLVAVALGLREVLEQRQAHRLGRAKAEGGGVADVELDDLVALALELLRAPRQRAADLVADVRQVAGGEHRGNRVDGGHTVAYESPPAAVQAGPAFGVSSSVGGAPRAPVRMRFSMRHKGERNSR